MLTLTNIRDICDRYDCCDGCPLLGKDDDFGHTYCLLDPPPSMWDFDKIEEVLKDDKTA